MKTVTILLSTYNGEKYLEEQLESIFNQKNCLVRIAARDDGSSDSTREILEKYEKQGKLIWYGGENLGPAKSFYDLLIKSGDSDYYAFADQDDIWEENKLEQAVSRLLCYEKEIALYTSNVSLIDSQGKMISPKFFYGIKNLTFENTLVNNYGGIGCTMVFNRKLAEFLKCHPVPEKIIMHDFFVLQTAAIFGKIVYDDTPLVRYRQHENNVLGIRMGFFQRLQRWIKTYFGKPEISNARHLQSVLDVFNDEIPENEKKRIKLVADYPKNMRNRIKLLFSEAIVAHTKKREFAYRISILLGNF